MTILGWGQIALFVALIVLVTRQLGGYLTHVVTGERTLLSPVLAPVERIFYRAAGVDPRTRAALADLCPRHAAVQRCRACCCSTRLQRLQAILPLNPQGMPAVPRGPGAQHRGQLRHQHQLAELRRRGDHELPRPDGRADGAELPLGRDRHRPRGGADPRLRAAGRRRPSATSGST